MQKTKTAIAVMTVLIILGLGLLIYGITAKSANGTEDPFIAGEINATITLTPAAEIKHISPYKNLMALHIDAPEGEHIYFLDPQNGAIKGRIEVGRANAPETTEDSE